VGEVVFFVHQGVEAAVPAHQVLGALTGGTDTDPTISLWTTLKADISPEERVLEVVTGDGSGRVGCSQVRLGWLAPDELRQLPPILRALLPFPHLVGVATRNGNTFWLVDLKRCRPIH